MGALTDERLDELCQSFELAWQVCDAGARGVLEFMRSSDCSIDDLPILLAALASIDLERAWMEWGRWLNCHLSDKSAEQILNRFSQLPTLSNYRQLLQDHHPHTELWRSVAVCELLARNEWGDAIGARYFEELLGCELRHECTTTPRVMEIKFNNPKPGQFNKRFAIRGLTTIGRQRSTDSIEYLCEVRPNGNRITVAGKLEAEISRHQLEAQLLHPNFVIVRNTGKPKSALIFDTPIEPFTPICVRIPFYVQLPNCKLFFH